MTDEKMTAEQAVQLLEDQLFSDRKLDVNQQCDCFNVIRSTITALREKAKWFEAANKLLNEKIRELESDLSRRNRFAMVHSAFEIPHQPPPVEQGSKVNNYNDDYRDMAVEAKKLESSPTEVCIAEEVIKSAWPELERKLKDIAEAKADGFTTVGRFELRWNEEQQRLYWYGAEEGWKDPTEIGEGGVLTLNCTHFSVGTILTLREPVTAAPPATISGDEEGFVGE